MTTPLSPEYLAEIAARAEAATDDPWFLASATFDAHARTDIPTLLAEVERLRAELAARPTRDEADAEMQRATDGLREAWTSEIERLRRLHTGALAERDRYRSAWQSARYRAALTHLRRTA